MPPLPLVYEIVDPIPVRRLVALHRLVPEYHAVVSDLTGLTPEVIQAWLAAGVIRPVPPESPQAACPPARVLRLA